MKLLAFLGLLLPSAAQACLWDTDTLEAETQGKLDLVDAITGRFPRNPPLYYQMRLARVTAELAKNPNDLDAYDDAAVACERLEKSLEAIAWMAQKRQVLDTLPKSLNKEAWYRYYANLGTFKIHHWFRSGAKVEAIGEAQEARDLIAKALEINPNAHFGRERAQLRTMEWVIDVKLRPPGSMLASYLDKARTPGEKPGDTIKGLAGLVVLGNAWGSPDLFHALAIALSMKKDSHLATLAKLRAEELLKGGAVSLSKELAAEWESGRLMVWSWQPYDAELPYLEKSFRSLRRASDEYHAHRTEFMLERLKAGRHPDTDLSFWNGYQEVPRGHILDLPRTQRLLQEYGLQFLAVGVVVVSVVGVILIRRWRRRARAKRQPGP
ncbi:MAG: hypothetical protein HZC36_15185 [Armatimonadetes bacterium]|nr:hypothetical protein [Armatimonadota bacterium]